MATIDTFNAAEDKHSVSWKNITVFFTDGSQVTARDHPEDPDYITTLAAGRKVLQTETSEASISGSYEDCIKQLN